MHYRFFLSPKILQVLSVAAVATVGSFSAQAAYEKNYIGDMETYTAVYEDTLVHLARKNKLGFVEVRAANPKLDPWIPGEGAQVILPKRHLLPEAPREGLVINLPEMRVYAYLNGDEAPYTYPLGVGREGLETPVGETKVVRKKDGPIWYPTERMREEDPELPKAVPPGPDNPLGTHALYFGWPTYLMHGTNRPYGIGRRVSSGCIRMYPEDIKVFFEQVPVGTKVNVINEPIKVSWIEKELYLEAHPDLEQSINMASEGIVEHEGPSEEVVTMIVDKAGMFKDRLNWPRIRATLRERKGYPVRIAKYYAEGEEPVESDSAQNAASETLSTGNDTLDNAEGEASDDAVDTNAVVASSDAEEPKENTDVNGLDVDDESEVDRGDDLVAPDDSMTVIVPKQKPASNRS